MDLIVGAQVLVTSDDSADVKVSKPCDHKLDALPTGSPFCGARSRRRDHKRLYLNTVSLKCIAEQQTRPHLKGLEVTIFNFDS
jgi:hypothetical protein